MRIFGPMIASEFAEKMDSAGAFIVALIVVMVFSAAWNEFSSADKRESSARHESNDAEESVHNAPNNVNATEETPVKSKRDFAGHNSFDLRSSTFKMRHEDEDRSH